MGQRDVLTFGETMLRLSPPGATRLSQASALDVWIAGSESNVAVALSALGHSVSWVSRLPDQPMGRKVEAVLRAGGVDVSYVVWTGADERVGLFYAEPGAAPRAGTVVYDRARSAASFLCPDDLPDALFDAHRHLHVSGITPALSESCAHTVADAIERAKSRGMTISLDVNYRAKLWLPEAAAASLAPLMEQIDVLLCSRGDASRLFDLNGDALAQARALRARFGVPVTVLTAGQDGAVGCEAGNCRAMPAIPIAATVERLGSGDAFAAGFLSVFLSGGTLEQGLRLGVAAAALKRTIPGDMLLATRQEIEAVMAPEVITAWR